MMDGMRMMLKWFADSLVTYLLLYKFMVIYISDCFFGMLLSKCNDLVL